MVTRSPDSEQPPQHVCAAFGVGAATPEPIPDSTAWRCADVVLKPANDRAHAVWLAGVLERVDAPDLRIARPVRSTDGRTLLAGWQAYRRISGSPTVRSDDLLLTAVKLHQATAQIQGQPPLVSRGGAGATADRLAWGEQDVQLNEDKGGRWFEILAGSRRPVSLPDQLVHGELCGRVLFDGEAAPGVVDFVPYYRPAEWGAAVTAVDVLARGADDGELLRRWSHLPEWPQMLLRAMLFRLAGHALDPHGTRDELDGLLYAAHEVSELL